MYLGPSPSAQLDDYAELTRLRAHADLVQVAMDRVTRLVNARALRLGRATESDSARHLRQRQLEERLAETTLAIARLIDSVDRAMGRAP